MQDSDVRQYRVRSRTSLREGLRADDRKAARRRCPVGRRREQPGLEGGLPEQWGENGVKVSNYLFGVVRCPCLGTFSSGEIHPFRWRRREGAPGLSSDAWALGNRIEGYRSGRFAGPNYSIPDTNRRDFS